MNNKISYWLELAHYDFDSAKIMLDGCRYLYVGFMCHQTIEKALKAYYSGHNEDTPPYTHNLIRLSEVTGLLEGYTDKQREIIMALNPLNIEARYPIKKKNLEALLTRDYCKKLIEDTEGLLQWIESKL